MSTTSLPSQFVLRGRYRIEAALGQGGFGTVYRAWDLNLEKWCAVKENADSSPEAARQFFNEAKILADLTHPNLPRVIDHFMEGQKQYLVMDFIQGTSLEDGLKKLNRPLEEKYVLGWATQILDALAYLHAQQPSIIHRDIKPANIIVTPQNKPMLVDFGISKLFDEQHKTTKGAAALTEGYAPPEQYGLGKTDARTDLYALGATLYRLLTNTVPPASTALAAGIVPSPKTAQQLNPNVSPHLSAAIAKAMQIRMEARFANAEEFKAALMGKTPLSSPPVVMARPAGSTKPVTSASAQPTPPTRKPDTTGASWLVPTLLAVGGIGLIAFIGILALAPNQFPLIAAWLPTSTPSLTPSPTTSPTITLTPSTTPTPSQTNTATITPLPTHTATSTDTFTPSPTPTPSPSPTSPTPQGGGVFGQIAFVSERTGKPQIFVLSVPEAVNGQAEPQVKQLTDRSQGACQPTWSPDGEYLLFVSPCDRPKSVSNKLLSNASLYRMKADGSEVQEWIVKLNTSTFDPDWSAAGIAFTCWDGSSNRPHICLADADGSNIHDISEKLSADSQPSWSGDGSGIAFRNSSRADQPPTIFRMKSDGSYEPGRTEPEYVTRNTDAGQADWATKSNNILYVTGQNICIVSKEAFGFGSGLCALTDKDPKTDGRNDDPAWSPDERWLTFTSWRDATGNRDIYISNLSGSEVYRLTTNEAADYHPTWRP